MKASQLLRPSSPAPVTSQLHWLSDAEVRLRVSMPPNPWLVPYPASDGNAQEQKEKMEHMEVARMMLELEPASVPSLVSVPPSMATEEVKENVHTSADAVVNNAMACVAAVRKMLLELEPKAYEQASALFNTVRAVDNLDMQLGMSAGDLGKCALRRR